MVSVPYRVGHLRGSCCKFEDNKKSRNEFKTVNQKFSGDWSLNSEIKYTFVLHLNQKRDSITGGYYAAPLNLSRIDGNTDKKSPLYCEITGTVKGDTAYINFISCYSGDTGRAKLFFKDSILCWRTIFNPSAITKRWNGVLSSADFYRDYGGMAVYDPKSESGFAGFWKIPTNKKFDFWMLLSQNGSQLKGNYGSDSTNKVFCSDEDDTTLCKIWGMERNDTAYFRFNSCMTCDTGTAIAFFVKKDKILHWKTNIEWKTKHKTNWNGIPDDIDLVRVE